LPRRCIIRRRGETRFDAALRTDAGSNKFRRAAIVADSSRRVPRDSAGYHIVTENHLRAGRAKL
jgi:hypothetical protein